MKVVTRIFVAITLAMILLVIGYVSKMMLITNPGVIEELKNNPEGERAARVMLLGFEDGSSIPVNYLREGNKVFAGADGPWWRSLVDGARVTIFIKGESFTGQASVVLDNQTTVDDVFSRLRPNAPSWLPDWMNGKLVVITIEDSAK